MVEIGKSFLTGELYVKMSLDEYHELVGRADKCERSQNKSKTGYRGSGALLVR